MSADDHDNQFKAASWCMQLGADCSISAEVLSIVPLIEAGSAKGLGSI